jgi:hypothetical protein
MLNTPDKSNNPNGPLSTGALINYSAEPYTCRVDFFGIATVMMLRILKEL